MIDVGNGRATIADAVLLNTKKVGRLFDGVSTDLECVIQGTSGIQGRSVLELPGTICGIVWEQVVPSPIGLVGLADVASVSVTIVLSAPGRDPEATEVGNGSYVKDGKTREVVPDGQVGKPSMTHGSVG